MKRFRWGALLSIGATLALGASMLTPTSAATADSPDTATASANSGVLTDVQNLVDSLGTTVYPSIYGGFTAPDNGAEIDVYLTSLNPVVEAAFNALSSVTNIVFTQTPNTIATLDSMTDTLESDWDTVDASGINLNQFGPDVEQGVLDIGVVDLTPSDITYFDNMFGAANVNIFNVSQADADSITTQVTRTADTAPYNGGDAIMNGAHTNGCTSGFGVRVGGVARMTTAGHCFNVGAHVVNAKVDNGATNGWTGSNSAMGTVTSDPFKSANSSTDAELFTGCNSSGTCGGDDLIFTGAIGNPQLSIVSGIGVWADGDQVCSSGAYGGERCGMTVQRVNYCTKITQDDGTTRNECHLTRVTGTSVTQPGDSGAPIFRFSGQQLLAVGINTGGNGVNTTYFTGINAVLSSLGATLITG